MDRVLLGRDLQGKLSGLQEPLELCDEAGRVVGHFLPAAVYDDLRDAALAAEFSLSKEELRRRRNETSGRPLSEIWKSLGQS